MNRLVLIFGLLSLFPLSGASQNLMHMTSDSAVESSVFVPIAKYLQRGDAECLAAWFADNLSSTSKTKIFSINFRLAFTTPSVSM